ncbi:MAG: chemotaxis protein CheW [Elusimicrobiota bacterium]
MRDKFDKNELLKKGLFKNTRNGFDSGNAKTEDSHKEKQNADSVRPEGSVEEKAAKSFSKLQVVSFRLGDSEYGLDVKQIEKVIWMVEITKVPKAGGIIEGIIDLKGRIVPVADLRKILGGGRSKYTKDTQIIISKSGEKEFGIIIDNIIRVFSLDSSEIIFPNESLPRKEFLMGAGETKEGLLPLLDLEKIVSVEDEKIESTVSDLMDDSENVSEIEVKDSKLKELFHRRALELAEKKEVKKKKTEDYLVFNVEKESYAIELKNIKEVLLPLSIVPLPSSPGWLLGVINLRGDILAVMDLKKLFGLKDEKDSNGEQRLVVIEKEDVKFCLLVDGVKDIFALPVESIDPPLSTLKQVKAGYLKGEVSYGKDLIALINLDNMIKSVGENI